MCIRDRCDNTIFDTELLLKKGDFCLIAPHISHGVKNFDDNSIVINILVRESTFLDTFMNYIKAVSYTHLDVYKRQIQTNRTNTNCKPRNNCL